MFDGSALRSLRESSPRGPALVARVLGVWLRDSETRLAEARSAIASGDREVAHRAVHSLKSASALVGALRFSTRCREAEEVFGRGDLRAELLDLLEREHAEAEAVLRDVLASETDRG